MNNRTKRLLELANSKRHLFVTSDSEIFNFVGHGNSRNCDYVASKFATSKCTGPFTLDEARIEAKRIFDARLRKSEQTIKAISFKIERQNSYGESDFLPFLKA